MHAKERLQFGMSEMMAKMESCGRKVTVDTRCSTWLHSSLLRHVKTFAFWGNAARWGERFGLSADGRRGSEKGGSGALMCEGGVCGLVVADLLFGSVARRRGEQRFADVSSGARLNVICGKVSRMDRMYYVCHCNWLFPYTHTNLLVNQKR